MSKQIFNLILKAEAIAKEGQPFQRVEVSREEALEMFEENKFKVCCGASFLADVSVTSPQKLFICII